LRREIEGLRRRLAPVRRVSGYVVLGDSEDAGGRVLRDGIAPLDATVRRMVESTPMARVARLVLADYLGHEPKGDLCRAFEVRLMQKAPGSGRPFAVTTEEIEAFVGRPRT
jgi:hypothetical protein